MEIKVSLDRITISSPVIKHNISLIEWQNYLKNTDWEQISDNEFRLVRLNENGTSENVAELFKNPYQHESWRIDTSNHLENKHELAEIQRVVKFMSKPKITRIDIAFDIINGTKPNMAHRIYKPNTSSSIFASDLLLMRGRNNAIQSYYVGKRKSEKMVRLYDKVVEQKSRRKKIPEGVKKWERLELQLRSAESNNWVENAREMLSYFKMPAFENIEKATDRAMMYALDNNFINFKDLSNGTATKFRKLIKNNVGFDTEYSELMLKVLEENIDNLKNEIDSFISNFSEIEKDDQTD